MYERHNLICDGRQLRLFSDSGLVVASIETDSIWPGMWRVRLPDGHLTDLVNLSRAKDAAASLALAALNLHHAARPLWDRTEWVRAAPEQRSDLLRPDDLAKYRVLLLARITQAATASTCEQFAGEI
jgi:hypothetical protein